MLIDSLKVLYGTNFAYFVKAFGFHHNVEGPDFLQLHEFFSAIYNDAYAALDPIAEYIRTLNEYAPGSFERFAELTQIPGQTKIPRARLMLEELTADNATMIDLLNTNFAAATEENQQAIADYLSQRLSQHGKFGWQLKSFLKDARA